MKVKLFTHTDLDGVGCAIVGKYAFNDIDVTYCDYHNVNKIIGEYLSNKDFMEYECTFITDISVDETNADIINYHYGLGNKFKLIDHHPTAYWLNKYEWAYVNPLHDDGTKSSGTSMFYDYLNQSNSLYQFVEKVRRYDTWEWSTKYNDTHAKQLNDLLHLIGRDKFVERFIQSSSIEFNETEKIVLEMEQNKIEKYIKDKQKQLLEIDVLNYSAGVVFAEQYNSELGNELAKANNHLDFIVMINPSTAKISYRGVKEDIDLGRDVAKVFGGGGHPRAAGSQIKDGVILKLIEGLFLVN